MDCSDAWVLNQSEQAPAFVAARAGYDVWLGNLRGNRYSSKHEYLDPERNAEKFFDFDIGHHHKYDLVAMIQFIKQTTDVPKLAYVGHSMGTTIFFRLAAENPSFVEDSISSFVGIGPVVVPAHSNAPVVKAVMPVQDFVYNMLHFAHFYALG